MRPIKFRAWSHHWKKMFEVTHLDFNRESDSTRGFIATGYVDFEGNQGDIWDATFDGKDFTLMQFTGLKDINGKEIYEGDIVKASGSYYDNENFIGEVVYDLGFPSFGVKVTENDYRGLDEQMEVIGNIFENKEILK